MTNPVFIEDFRRRRRQVRRYLSTVSRIERDTMASTRLVDMDRLHVVRAGTFLILYNLIEASARGALEAIHDEMTTSRVSFSNLTPIIRRELVKGFKRRAKAEEENLIVDLTIDFVAIALDTEAQFSGNVDARLIRSIAQIYGFSTDTNPKITGNGADLLTIKTNRNDLAHGRKTYDEVGRSFVARDLIRLSYRAMHYIEGILGNIENFINEKNYLASPNEIEQEEVA